jgi:hypothetical protein
MKIHITIDADSGDDLRRGLFDLLVERHAVDAIAKLSPKPDAPKPEKEQKNGDLPKDVATKRKHRATNPTPAGPPQGRPEPVDEEEIEMPPEPEKEPFVDEPDELEQALKSNGSAADAVANEKLKKETIAKLAELFTAGKVKVVRHVLEKYGQGAKSFPEIDASQFPLIRDAIAKGETA